MRLPGGLHIDDPAWPVLQATVSFVGITDGAYDATGYTFQCAGLANEPDYAGSYVKILGTTMLAGQVRPITYHLVNTITVGEPFMGGIPVGTPFMIISGGGGMAPGPVTAPSVGLWMLGEVSDAAGLNIVRCDNLAGFNNDIFNDNFYMQVLLNFDAPGTAPEGEIRLITNYAIDGTFTVNPFSAAVGVGDLVAIIHESQINVWVTVDQIFNLVNAILTLKESGGTITTDGTEQDVYRNDSPMGVYKPKKVMIDFYNNAVGDTIVVRVRYRLRAGGTLRLKDEIVFSGVQSLPIKNIELEPNRFGVQVTMQRTAGGQANYDWEVFYED